MSNLGPTLDDLTHHPAVPRPNETTKIEIAAADPDGIGNVTLHWSTDGADFQESAMNLEGDRYSASVPAQQADAVIQFYVEATGPVKGPFPSILEKEQTPARCFLC